MLDPLDAAVLPSAPKTPAAIGGGLGRQRCSPRTASGGSARPWVPPEGIEASGVEHVEGKGEPAVRDLGAVRHGDDRGRPVPGEQSGPQ